MSSMTGDSTPPGDYSAPRFPEVESALHEMSSRVETIARLNAEERRLNRELEAVKDDLDKAERSLVDDRIRLALAVIAGDPRPLPEFEEWYHDFKPLWRVRSGGRIIALVAGFEQNPPKDEEQAAESVSIAVIDLA